MKKIPLTQGKVALVDDADFDSVSKFKWCADHNRNGLFYAIRNLKKSDGTWTMQRLHQFLMPEVKRIDHEDGNGLNCQRYNLRPASTAENGRGFRRKPRTHTSKYRGVSWTTRDQRWYATIRVGGKQFNLGNYVVEKDAAHAYNNAATKYFGQFATLNKIN